MLPRKKKISGKDFCYLVSTIVTQDISTIVTPDISKIITQDMSTIVIQDILTIITQNDRLSLAHSAANIWACHQSIHKSWSGNFSGSLQRVEILVLPGAGTFLQPRPQFVVQRIEVWTGGEPVIHFSWDLGCALANHFCIFLLCEQAQNPTESMNHLCPQIQFPPEVVRHRLTWLGRPHHLFLHWHHRNESGWHRRM